MLLHNQLNTYYYITYLIHMLLHNQLNTYYYITNLIRITT